MRFTWVEPHITDIIEAAKGLKDYSDEYNRGLCDEATRLYHELGIENPPMYWTRDSLFNLEQRLGEGELFAVEMGVRRSEVDKVLPYACSAVADIYLSQMRAHHRVTV